MAKSVIPGDYSAGFYRPGEGTPWVPDTSNLPEEERPHYVPPPSTELLTSTVHNDQGLNVLRSWPTLYDGTNSPHGLPSWWTPKKEVDVLISGAGPSGLQVALSLARQGVSFRIIDKKAGPLTAGRADGVQPRFLETLHSWGLAEEVHEEGPLIEHTAIYKDGKPLLFAHSHQSDSRYRGLHIITQGQIERIYLRDLLRHKSIVERETVIKDFDVLSEDQHEYPIKATLKNEATGAEEDISAKFIVGSDGAASFVRKKLQIPFDGVSTDIYWGILDAKFDSDYPHAWMFGPVLSSKHGGCVIIPREDGYIRLYTQLDVSATGPIARSRQGRSEQFQEEGGNVDVHSVTAEEVLEQANKIFAPYTLKFASKLSWFAVWKISERVARSFSSPDMRVHLTGDAAHIHSVMGAFGLNASILDSANLAWKIGLAARNVAGIKTLVPTFDLERRHHANRIIRVSGSYLRFVCNSELPLASFSHSSNIEDAEQLDKDGAIIYVAGEEQRFLREFFGANGKFLLGVDAAYNSNALVFPRGADAGPNPIMPRNGVRAPNPRLCFGKAKTGYLYDALRGAGYLHVVLFASDLQGPVRKQLVKFSQALASREHFFHRYGPSNFNIVLVTKCQHFEAAPLLADPELAPLLQHATVLYDDRTPDEDAHTIYGVDHAKGAAVFVRPDLWVGHSAFLGDVEALDVYFGGWMLPASEQIAPKTEVAVESPLDSIAALKAKNAAAYAANGHSNGANGHSNGYSNGYSNGLNGHSNGQATNGHSNGYSNGNGVVSAH